MNARIPNHHAAQASSGRNLILWLLAVGCLLLIALGLLRQRPNDNSAVPQGPATTARPAASANSSNAARDRLFARLPQRRSNFEPALTPEQVVSNKLAQFARSRRDIVEAMAKKFDLKVPADVERFFAAAEAGRLDELKGLYENFKMLLQSEESARQVFSPEEFRRFWPAMLETLGVAEVAHEWPAQQLLDYGSAVLGALRPGMVYVGGTDAGRYIPTLLNETSGGEPHIIVTQNALADGTYLNYLGFLYGDRMATLTGEESQRAFQSYISDAKQRFEHDRAFPDEPSQLRPGEDVRVTDNRVQISGQVAVMAINERLLQTLLAKNPDLGFALEESYPFKSTYGAASPLGPLMELRASDDQNQLSAERAGQSLDYWRAAAQRFEGDSEALDSNTRKAWAQMATAQGNLFAGRQYSAEAEQTYRLARDIAPDFLEPIGGLARLLVDTGRAAEAGQLLDDFARAHSGQRGAVEAFRRTLRSGPLALN
jgi:hypothetical protein